jgi:hypothetical protein
MFRSARNLVFRSDAPPVFAATSIALFVASMVVFWLWMSFASHLPPLPCKATDTLVHFRSSTLCASHAQAAHWAREDFTWKFLFASSFLVHWGGLAYRKFIVGRETPINS